MSTIRFKPEKRLTAVGYSITSVDGSIPQFNILQPLGTSQYKYQQPVASLSVDLGHKLPWNTGWNHYHYNEGSFVGATAPRYFHANSPTESLVMHSDVLAFLGGAGKPGCGAATVTAIARLIHRHECKEACRDP